MKRNPENLTKVLGTEHENNWIAVSRDYGKILNYDKSLSNLKKLIGKKDVVYMKIPPAELYLSF